MLKRILYSFLPIFLLSPFLSAQSQASLGGTVQDSSGAVIASASVRLTSVEQGTVRTTVTNASGVYQFSFLPAGTYNVEISASGFKTLESPDIALAVDQSVRHNFVLIIGALNQSVIVSEAAPLLNTDDAASGQVIETKTVVQMPLNGRVFYNLASLTPGVMLAAQNSTNATRGGFNTYGQCDVCNNYTLDGVFDNNLAVGGIPTVRPSIDSIQEFNVLTGVYSAQYGFNSGGQIVVTTKSGTNSFHGSLYEFLRNQDLNARNYFTAPGTARPAFRSNQFGGVVGGPIQKDKTFFFFGYEGFHFTQAVQSLVTYPTLAMHSGDFSGISQVIKDPNTGVQAISGGKANVIPSGEISPIGQALMNLYPNGANTTGGALPSNNANFQENRPETYNSFDLKLDHTFSGKDFAYASGNYYKDQAIETGQTVSAGCTPYYLPQFTCGVHTKDQAYALGETHIFSSALVNQAHIGFSITEVENYDTTAYDDFWGPYGEHPLISPTATSTRVPVNGYPNTSITGYTTYGSGDVAYYHVPIYDFNDTISWTHGKHTISIGGDLLHFTYNNINIGAQAGTLTFTNSSAGPTSGYGLADLLFGLPATSADDPYKYEVYIRSVSPAIFVQDDFKISPKLTLNLGLRWEENSPPRDNADNLTGFDTITGLPAVQADYAPIPAATLVPFTTLGTRTLWTSDWYDYAPRLGFAYEASAKTVVNGGFGIFYNNSTMLANNILSFPGGPPYTTNNTYTSSKTAPVVLANAFPSSGAVTSNALYGANPNFKNPRTFLWTLAAQREITQNLLVSLSYAGNEGGDQYGTQNINQPAPGQGTPAQVQARRPYPNFGTISYIQWGFQSHFNSAILKVTQRYSHGLQFLGSYVFSHATDDQGAATNAYNLATAEGASNFDVRHRIVGSIVWDIPYGAERAFGKTGLLSDVLGDWEISPLFQWQTGIPLTATLSGNYSNSGGTTDRPNVIGNPNSGAPHTIREFFNTSSSVWQIPPANGQTGAPDTFGDEGRNIIRGPRFTDLDVNLSKTFPAWETLKGQLRCDFFDLPNHPNWGLPGLVANTSTFGTIASTVTGNNESGGNERILQVSLKVVF